MVRQNKQVSGPSVSQATPTKEDVDGAVPDEDLLGSPNYNYTTTKGMEQLDYLIWNIKRTGALTIGELIMSMSKCKKQSKWLNLYSSPQFSVLAKKAFEMERAVSANLSWVDLLDTHSSQYETDSKFYDTDTSVRIFDHWCAHHHISKARFVKDLWDVVSGNLPKINCFTLMGPSNAGKSYILRTMRYISHAYGEIHAGDNNAFQFQNCINTNLIYIDEPRISPEIGEQFKLVMEGSPTLVKVKGRPDEILKQTPIIITSNSPVWRWCPSEKKAMQNRMKLYELKAACPWLKECKKMLNPQIWMTLFDMEVRDYKEDCNIMEVLLSLDNGKKTPKGAFVKATPAAPRKLVEKRRLFTEEVAVVKKPFCHGCSIDHPSQDQHTCLDGGVVSDLESDVSDAPVCVTDEEFSGDEDVQIEGVEPLPQVDGPGDEKKERPGAITRAEVERECLKGMGDPDHWMTKYLEGLCEGSLDDQERSMYHSVDVFCDMCKPNDNGQFEIAQDLEIWHDKNISDVEKDIRRRALALKYQCEDWLLKYHKESP